METDHDIIIRNALVSDAPRLTDLMRKTFEDAYAADIRPEDLRAHMDANFMVPLQIEKLSDPQVITLMAEAGDVPAGYAQMLPGPSPECVRTERPAQLLRFYLHRPYWGGGAAGMLMQRCLVELSRWKYTGVWLSTWARNGRARAFYRKWGFQAVGTAHFTVGKDRQTDNIMARPV